MAFTDTERVNSYTMGRVDALDGIRTFAVLAVFAYHIYKPGMRGGSIGVDVFFALSGLVITLLLLREFQTHGKIRLRAFYVNRVARLWPVLFAVSGLVAALSWLAPNWAFAGEGVNSLRSVLHLMNFSRGGWFGEPTTGGAMGHSWSLSVEEQFYLAWPFLLILAMRFLSLRAIFKWTLIAIGCIACLRLTLDLSGWGHERLYNGPDTRLDQLLAGCALAMFLHLVKPHSSGGSRLQSLSRHCIWPAVAFISAMAIFVAYRRGESWVDVSYRAVVPTVIALAAVMLFAGIIANPKHPVTRFLAHPWFAVPGRRMSYGFYLWHYPVIQATKFTIDGTSSTDMALRILVSLSMTVAISYLSARYFEEPIIKAVKMRLANRAFEQERHDLVT